MAYSYYALISIQNGKVSANETDFPVLISGTYDGTGGEPDIRTVGNGGKIQNTDATGGASGSVTVPADLVFSPNTDGSSPYDFEIEKYSATTGLIVAWVEIPSIASGTDTELYMVFGDSGVAASQEDVSGTWESSFKGVYHLGEPSGTCYDSTSNSHDLSNVVGSPSYGYTGKIGDSVASDGGGELLWSDNEMHTGTSLTVNFWRYRDSVARNLDGGVAYGGGNALFGSPAEMEWMIGFATNICNVHISSGGAQEYIINTADTIADWVMWGFTYDGSDLDLYRNGAPVGTEPATLTIQDMNNNGLAVMGRTGGAYDMDGSIDELSVSHTPRDADYMTTTHNSHSDPSTFYTMGAETGTGGGPGPRSFAVFIG